MVLGEGMRPGWGLCDVQMGQLDADWSGHNQCLGAFIRESIFRFVSDYEAVIAQGKL